MNRRVWAGAIVALACAAPWLAAAQTVATHTLSIATLAPTGSTWMRVFDSWNRELRRRTGGQLAFRFYPNGVQGDESEVVRKIRSGRIDGGAMTAVGLGQIHRPTVAFQIPGMFESYAQLDRARAAVRPDLDAAFERAGYVLLGWGDVGTDRIFANHAVVSPADFARTHPFVWRDDPVFPAFVAETGAAGVELQIPDVLGALQVHQIDSVVASPLAVASMQWAPRLTHMTDAPMAMEIGAIVVGRTQFAALPGELQAVLRETAAQFTQLMVRDVRHDDDATVPLMVARGLTVDRLTPADAEQWRAIFERTRARLGGALGDATWIPRVLAAAR